MNIRNLTIKNVKSFGEKVSINFQDNLNISIGPNAGGKSNLLDILNLTLIYFFLHPWRVRPEYDETGTVLRRKYFEERHTTFDPINRFLEKHTKREEETQQIKIVFSPEKEDIENIKNIITFGEELSNFEKREYNSNKLEEEFLLNLKEFNIGSLIGEGLEFIIDNNNPIQVSNLEQKYKVFFSYLRFFNFLNILVEEYNQSITEDSEKIPNLYPPIIYFSPYRISQIPNLTVTLSAINLFDLLEKYQKSDSKTISSTFDVANYYFAKKLRYLDDKTYRFEAEEEVKLIKKYVRKLGYKNFGYTCKNKERNIYEGFLIKMDNTQLDFSKASGGEKEILNFLMGIFALNVKNGVVIIDEPELHLHPKWQEILLELFDDFTKSRGIQFFIVTHSPHFITQKSIKNVLRVFAKEGESQVVPPPTLEESEKDLFQIINVFNNTKIFFADKVILVEGDTDNIIYDRILRSLQTEITKTEPTNVNKIEDRNKIEIIEILDVRGNENFNKFKGFLNKWEIKFYIISDLDYLMKIGDETIKNLLEVDYKKMDYSLKEKTSKDGETLLRQLYELLAKPQISKEDLISCQELLDYLKSRYVKFKEDLSEEERKKINEFIEKKYEEKIYILKNGDIEDYFDSGHFDINNAIQITKKIEDEEIGIPEELENIVKKIIED